ncbi:Circumsporozoite-like 6 [Homarus americanus]|uniref:Circumsporozoite-like 6 n=1 Tax=Homarus americanus TaxID=6706 RepID=A0A8J5K6U9_HOMAM|nr:Circumsporozoite-like 6 [Homarus americanus]
MEILLCQASSGLDLAGPTGLLKPNDDNDAGDGEQRQTTTRPYQHVSHELGVGLFGVLHYLLRDSDMAADVINDHHVHIGVNLWHTVHGGARGEQHGTTEQRGELLKDPVHHMTPPHQVQAPWSPHHTRSQVPGTVQGPGSPRGAQSQVPGTGHGPGSPRGAQSQVPGSGHGPGSPRGAQSQVPGSGHGPGSPRGAQSQVVGVEVALSAAPPGTTVTSTGEGNRFITVPLPSAKVLAMRWFCSNICKSFSSCSVSVGGDVTGFMTPSRKSVMGISKLRGPFFLWCIWGSLGRPRMCEGGMRTEPGGRASKASGGGISSPRVSLSKGSAENNFKRLEWRRCDDVNTLVPTAAMGRQSGGCTAGIPDIITVDCGVNLSHWEAGANRRSPARRPTWQAAGSAWPGIGHHSYRVLFTAGVLSAFQWPDQQTVNELHGILVQAAKVVDEVAKESILEPITIGYILEEVCHVLVGAGTSLLIARRVVTGRLRP